MVMQALMLSRKIEDVERQLKRVLEQEAEAERWLLKVRGYWQFHDDHFEGWLRLSGHLAGKGNKGFVWPGQPPPPNEGPSNLPTPYLLSSK